ncbi:hypothetical protein SAMN05421666_1607 [Roseovarius nanhaiticus]|uniref:Uncharacterized protein n=1 Tax=Roseovarius nanhaiticus TaxID=573024 RepID=A0A1N7G2K3_9RHOB|nr:hypothetical protein [Roseovarius nanhaiticus]SEK38969.1 hypothetical protein SAMN05216208_0529 [Roseovarius nanhaiticus]SIS06812.1 hypothetical protein SAMN05421666_1607 [Roseovarius nanhaiticus]
MSAPDTNTEKTKPAHKTPIAGMIAVVVFALALLIGLVTWLSYAGNDPEDEASVEDGISTEVTDDATTE